MTVVFTHSQSTWNMGGEQLLRDETVRRGRRLITEGRGRQFFERGVRPSAKGRNSLLREGGSHSSKEGGSCSSRQGSPSAKGRTTLLSKVEGSRLSKEDGWQLFVERGRMPAREGGCQHKRGRMPAREREDASMREGGCRPFIERGRMPARSSREEGRHSLREGGGRCSLWWEGITMNVRLVGKFKV